MILTDKPLVMSMHRLLLAFIVLIALLQGLVAALMQEEQVVMLQPKIFDIYKVVTAGDQMCKYLGRKNQSKVATALLANQ